MYLIEQNIQSFELYIIWQCERAVYQKYSLVLLFHSFCLRKSWLTFSCLSSNVNEEYGHFSLKEQLAVVRIYKMLEQKIIPN